MGRGLSSEVIAAVCKLMSNLDLIYAAARMRVKATCVTTIGEPGTLSARLQPNHPVDDVEGITASVLEGLSFGHRRRGDRPQPRGCLHRQRSGHSDTI